MPTQKLIMELLKNYMDIKEFLNISQYSIHQDEKDKFIFQSLTNLHQHHIKHCLNYRKICNLSDLVNKQIEKVEDFPFLPVSAFKNHKLLSVEEEEVFKVLTSSGTTGQSVSRIFLDKETASLQTSALASIVTHTIGPGRLPMLIIDSKAIYSNKINFSARAAGVLGMSIFGKEHTYVLNKNFEFDELTLSNFLEKFQGGPILIFGFTFMVWKYLFDTNLEKKYDLSNAILIHSGGWKKMIEQSVTNEVFKSRFNEKFNLKRVYNFYGMVEQVGSIFIEDSDGNLHCPNFADIIIRDPIDFSVQPLNKPGLIQVISCLPKSYPGHSILTEDIGILTGVDNASNGWKGKSFRILGRALRADLRGCSDTFKA
jgi:phenylacetate-coenzyme A ligase PaaK-like adenylate-forming protein